MLQFYCVIPWEQPAVSCCTRGASREAEFGVGRTAESSASLPHSGANDNIISQATTGAIGQLIL